MSDRRTLLGPAINNLSASFCGGFHASDPRVTCVGSENASIIWILRLKGSVAAGVTHLDIALGSTLHRIRYVPRCCWEYDDSRVIDIVKIERFLEFVKVARGGELDWHIACTKAVLKGLVLAFPQFDDIIESSFAGCCSQRSGVCERLYDRKANKAGQSMEEQHDGRKNPLDEFICRECL